MGLGIGGLGLAAMAAERLPKVLGAERNYSVNIIRSGLIPVSKKSMGLGILHLESTY